MGKVTIFQISLCLVACCVGVSIIWCAILGWMLMLESSTLNSSKQYRNVSQTTESYQQTRNEGFYQEFQINHKTRDYSAYKVVKFVIGADCIGVLYYALIAEAITTVSHVCAVVLGIVLWGIFKWYYFLVKCK